MGESVSVRFWKQFSFWVIRARPLYVSIGARLACIRPLLPRLMAEAFKALGRDQNLGDWTPEKSVYKLIYILCLKELKEALETIRILAEATEDIEKFVLHCVEEGEVVQSAALLLVAWDKLVPENAEESLIGRCIWEKIGIINNQESLLMLTCGFECEGLECLKKKKKNLLVEWKLLRVLERARELIERYRHRDIDEEVPNYEVPYELACELHKFARMNLTPDDVYSDDVECLRPKLKQEEKVMLNKAINDRLQAMSMLPDFVAQDQAWLNEILEKRHSKMSTFNPHKPICCSQLPFKLSPPSRAYHTSRGFDFRQSLDVHQVASPSTSMFLPTARVCARLCLAAKRSLK